MVANVPRTVAAMATTRRMFVFIPIFNSIALWRYRVSV
jgi:hypothetical protein